ncbi:hypothetical protein PTKIN_Ptkin12aG0020400 [Pterospermum kingtungense]
MKNGIIVPVSLKWQVGYGGCASQCVKGGFLSGGPIIGSLVESWFVVEKDYLEEGYLVLDKTNLLAFGLISPLGLRSYQPPNLYYTPPENTEEVLIIGQRYGFSVTNDTALETVYRLNVGGQSISLMDDTGMLRLCLDSGSQSCFQREAQLNMEIARGFKFLVAEPNAGPIIWAEDSNVPVYKDYLFMSKKGDENKQNLTIDLHPKSAKYFDVILNGIEVFKLSTSIGNLARRNPQPESYNSTGRKSKMKQKLLISGGGCAVGLLIDTPLGLYGVDFFWVESNRKHQNTFLVSAAEF